MRPFLFRKIAIIFSFFTIVAIAVTVFLVVTGERMAAKNALLIDAAMEVKLHGALAHLWTEEVISGDTSEDEATVWAHIRKAEWYILAMLEGGANDGGVYRPLVDTSLRAQTLDVQRSLQEFEAIAKERLQDHSQSKTGSEIDQRFDLVFEEFLARADVVQTALLQLISSDLQRFHYLSISLVGFLLSFGVLIGLAIFRLEKRQAVQLSELASISTEVGKKNDELEGVLLNLPGASYTYLMPAGHDVPGPQDKITFVNKVACEEIWGIPADKVEADSMQITQLVEDPGALEHIAETIRVATHKLQPWHSIWPIVTPAGEKKWLEGRGHPIRQPDGATIWYSLVVDVTEKVQREEDLKREREVNLRSQKHQSIGQLTGGVAHDFNNLLAVILGNMELLRDGLADDEQLRLVDASIRATQRGADLTRNMLAFARKATLEPEHIDLNRLVNETRTWAGRTLPTSIAIETSLLAGLWTVKADPSSTESALLNLLLNARDAMPVGGRMTIETANVRIDEEYVDSRNEDLEPGRYVMLAVSDTGHGVTPENLDRVFEPFYSTKAPGAGSGLGLSMVDGFMRQSGGVARIYSEPDVGTTVKLFFKAVEQADTQANCTPIYEGTVTTGQRLLVVEDEPEVLSVIVATLERAGYAVRSATSGDEARILFEADRAFDLLLTDIVMPGTLQGTTLSRVLRDQTPELPVVFMSGYASEATVHGNGLRPEDIRLMKPVARNELLAAVRKALGQ